MKTKPTYRLAFPLATAIAALVLVAPDAMAQTNRYWDPLGSGGFGTVDGTVTWATTTNLIWTNSNTGATTRLGNHTTSLTDICNFGGPTASLGVSATTGNIPVTTVSAHSLSFNTLGNNLTLLGGDITLTAASSITTVNASQSHTITSVLAGAATSLTKAGAGTIILGGNNTYAGATIVNAGTLSITGTPTGTGAITLNGGTLNLGGGTANGSLASTALTLGGGAFSYTRTGGTTHSFTTTNINGGGASQISVVAGNTLNLGTVARGTGGTFNFANAGAGTVAALTASNDATGIMPGFTFGDSWAVANGTGVAINGLGSYTLTSVAGTTAASYLNANIDVDNSPGALDGAITANSLRFSSAAANTLNLTGFNNTLTSGSILVGSGVGANLSTISGSTLAGAASKDLHIIQNNTTEGLTISAQIFDNIGPTALTKSGAGLLTLGSVNTFTGGVFIHAGKLALATPLALGTSPNNVTFGSGSTGTLSLSGNPLTIPVLSTNSANPGSAIIENASASNVTLFIGGASNSTFAGLIQDGSGGGTLALQKIAAGTLTLPGANTYSGGTTLNGGTVAISNATSFGTGPVTVTGASRINATGGITYTNPINVGTQTLTMQNPAVGTSSTATFSGVLSGSGIISLPNSGSNAILGIIAFPNTANTFTGNVVLSSAGSGDEFFSFNSIGDAGNFTFQKNGNRQGIIYAGSSDIVFNTRQINLGTTFLGGPTNGLDGGGTNPIMSFVNNGAGTVTFNSNMAMTTVAGSGVLFFDGSNTGNNTFAGTIGNPSAGGNLSIGKIGVGTWLLSGSNTYAGNTQIFDGILSVNAISNAANAQPLGQGSLIWLGNRSTTGTLRFTGASNSTTDKQVRIGGSTAGDTGGGRILNNGDGSLTFSNGTFNQTISSITATRTLTLGGSNTGANTISGIIQNNAAGGLIALTKADAGTWVLNGVNTFTGTTSINAGALQAINGNGLPTNSILQLRGGVLQSSGTFTRVVSATTSGSGAVNWGTGSGGFAAKGAPLILNLDAGTASLTWNGSSMVPDGQTLIFGSTTADNLVDFQNSLNLGSGTVQVRTITVNDNPGSTTDIARISGTITNTTAGMSLIKNGDGTLELTAANTYSGATTVNAGTLDLGATGSITTSTTLAIAAGAALDTDAQATYVIPAAQPLTFGIDATGSGSCGKIVAAGLDITAAVVTYNITGTPDDPVYVLATYSGTLTGAAFASVPAAPVGYTLQYAYEGNKIALVQSAGGTYASWIAGFPGVGLLNGVTDDADNDGIDNGVEMVIGGNPATGMDTALMPTIELVTDPVSTPTIAPGDYLLFTYRRTSVSETALVAASCETDTDLVAPWTPAVNAVSGVVIQEDLNFSFTPSAPADTDRVRVYVPRGVNTKLFGRLNVVVP